MLIGLNQLYLLPASSGRALALVNRIRYVLVNPLNGHSRAGDGLLHHQLLLLRVIPRRGHHNIRHLCGHVRYHIPPAHYVFQDTSHIPQGLGLAMRGAGCWGPVRL